MEGKEKILDAALIEFAEKGPDGARVDRIAKQAGVNKALIYYYYKNKEELYAAVINDLFVKATPMELKFPEGSVRDTVLVLLEQFLIFLHRNPLFIKLMDQAVWSEKEIFGQIPVQDMLYDMWMALYREGVAKGETRELENPEDYIVSLLGACYFFYSHRNAIGKFYDAGKTDEEILQMRIRTMKDIASRVFLSDVHV